MNENNSAPTPWDTPGVSWIASAGVEKEPNLYLEFARRFDADGGASLTLLICAASLYRVSVNGVVIGRGPAPADAACRYYHEYGIPAESVRAGENLITVLLFHDGETTETVQGFRYGKPGLLVHLSDSRTGEILAVSDSSWHVRRSPLYSPRPQIMPTPAMVSKWGGYKEFYYGERADGWETPGFDHSSWEHAVVVGTPNAPEYAATLLPVGIPELVESLLRPERLIEASNSLGRVLLPDSMETLPAGWTGRPIRFVAGEPGAMPSVILDYGRIVVGHPEITVAGAGCRYEVWYGETLDLLRCDVVRPGPNGRWRAFQRRAYRYIKLNFIALEGEVTLTDVSHHNAWYDYDTRGELSLDDPLAQQILSVTRYTQRASTSHHYEDCPVREQALWIMDMRVMALVNTYLYHNPELTAKCLHQSFVLQDDNGSVPATGPRGNNLYHPDFMMHLVATLREHYQHTGDRDLVVRMLPAARRLAGYLASYRADNGLLDTDLGLPFPFLDWSFQIEKRGQTTILNALYKRFLEDMAALETLHGDVSEAHRFCSEADVVGRAINRHLFWEEKGVYRDAIFQGNPVPIVSLQANLAAIHAGLVPKARVNSLLKTIWDSPEYPRPFGPSYYLIVLEALAASGRTDAIWPVIRDYWGEMLARGATTWWEVFDPTTPEWSYPHTFLGNTATFECDWIPISACHGWSNVPGYIIPRYLLGVDLSQIADRKIVIRPAIPAEWKRIAYAVPVAGGMLRLQYSQRGGETHVEVLERPEGIEIVL
jgi:hypothetical protein